MNDSSQSEVQRFFDAIDNVMYKKDQALSNARRQYRIDHQDPTKGVSIGIRYTLQDGITWESYEDKKNNVSGWRPIRRRTIFDLFYRLKHGHDKDFVERLPEGPTRCPASYFVELWSWNRAIDSDAIHVLMLEQELQRFQVFALLANILKPSLLNESMEYREARTFNSMAYGISSIVASSIHWKSIQHFHQEVMQAMTQIP